MRFIRHGVADVFQLSTPALQARLVGERARHHLLLELERFARAGKAVFCEKPIDLDVARVEACLKVVEATGARLMVGFNRRFDPHFRAGIIAIVGALWIWFAGIIIAQCTGMTDWSPISGMALLTVVLVRGIRESAGLRSRGRRPPSSECSSADPRRQDRGGPCARSRTPCASSVPSARGP